MKKLFDQAIGKDVHVVLEAADDGKLDVRVTYPVSKLHGPVTSFLQKITAKVPFISSRIPFFVNGLFSQFGVSFAPVVSEDLADDEVPPQPATAAHTAAPIEPLAPQA